MALEKALEWWGSGEGDVCASDGVGEAERLRVQVKSVAGSTIEHIANDGAIKTQWMRGMYKQLVCAASQWMEFHQRVVATTLQHLIFGDCAFAVNAVHHLSRPVVGI